jgi:hypothetical protein
MRTTEKIFIKLLVGQGFSVDRPTDMCTAIYPRFFEGGYNKTNPKEVNLSQGRSTNFCTTLTEII